MARHRTLLSLRYNAAATGNALTRIALGLFVVLLASLSASGQSKIYVERDGSCDPTGWSQNPVQCNAWAHMEGKEWLLACNQLKNNTNDCFRLRAGNYTFDTLKRDVICDPMDQSCTTKKARVLMKFHSTPLAVYTAVETNLQ